MKKFFLLITILLLLTACAPAQVAVQALPAEPQATLPPSTLTASAHLIASSTPTVPSTPFPMEESNWTGDGTIHIIGNNTGFEISSTYTYTISFQAQPDGTIAGEGVLKKVEDSFGNAALKCKRPGVEAVIFPPMKVMGTFRPAAEAQTEGIFQMNIIGMPEILPALVECVASGNPYSYSSPMQDSGISLESLEIANTDGAQANGVQDLGTFSGATGSANWELQIHTQAAP
jgi:hypothetical protein